MHYIFIKCFHFHVFVAPVPEIEGLPKKIILLNLNQSRNLIYSVTMFIQYTDQNLFISNL